MTSDIGTSEDHDHDHDHDHDGPLQLRASDALLAALTSTANRSSDFRLGITVVVPGGVICGDLVGGPAFMAAFDIFEGDQSLVEMTKDWWPPQDVDDEDDEADDGDSSVPIFMHLLDAGVWHGESRLPSEGQGVPYRVRINDISAWTFGKLNSTGTAQQSS